MKRTALTFILFIFCFDCFAQVTVGFRGGATYWFSSYGIPKKTQLGNPDPHLNWDKDIVVRYSFRRWAIETSIGHYKYAYGSFYRNLDNAHPLAYRTSILKTTENIFIISTVAQYNYASIGRKKQVKNYIGPGIGTHYYTYKNEHTTETVSGQVNYYKYNSNATSVWPGIHHTISYNVNNRLQLNSQMFFRYYFYHFLSSSMPINSQAGIGIGAAYKL